MTTLGSLYTTSQAQPCNLQCRPYWSWKYHGWQFLFDLLFFASINICVSLYEDVEGGGAAQRPGDNTVVVFDLRTFYSSLLCVFVGGLITINIQCRTWG